MIERDKVEGCLVGLACGDALGAPLEFRSRHEVRSKYPHGLREMIASSFWERGEYTDDTQMALLLAEGLLEDGRLVPSHVADKFFTWAETAKDVGIQTRAVVGHHRYVERPQECAERYFDSHPNSSAGNGAVMRCAPVALFYLNDRKALIDASRLSARLTHADPLAQSSCVLLNVAIACAVRGIKDARPEALAELPAAERQFWNRLLTIELCDEDKISSSGYTLHTLLAAFHSFLTTESFEEAVVKAVNLGDDADTVGAVTGALAGAYYGYQQIPRRWLAVLKGEEHLRRMAYDLAFGKEEAR